MNYEFAGQIIESEWERSGEKLRIKFEANVWLKSFEQWCGFHPEFALYGYGIASMFLTIFSVMLGAPHWISTWGFKLLCAMAFLIPLFIKTMRPKPTCIEIDSKHIRVFNKLTQSEEKEPHEEIYNIWVERNFLGPITHLEIADNKYTIMFKSYEKALSMKKDIEAFYEGNDTN